MPQPDLVLLHPPSLYDFRDKAIMYGPISDVVPPTPIFEMYPIGFVSILGYLEQQGYNVRIVNIALKMLKDQKFDPESLIRGLRPKAFGIDFHWLVHAQGSLELARIVKSHHPDTPVILGGLSSTYFHTQIIENYLYVDYVVRGDTTEYPLHQLMHCIEENRDPQDVPNITWRDSNGKIRINPLSFVPDSLDDFVLDAGRIVKSSLKYRDISGHLPYHGWNSYPITSVFACKGCIFNCITCGGSQYSYQRICNRSSIAYSKPEKIVSEVKAIEKYVDGPVFILGDLRIAGKNYAESVLDLMKKEKVDSPMVIELFTPANKDYLEKIAGSLPSFSLEISPESHDERVRHAFGRPYGNDELEKTLSNALELGCQRLDVFFMMGLPYQTKESALDTAKYCQSLIEEYGGDNRLHPFIAPLAPFLDPGSIAFENPKNHGYDLFYRGLEEYRQAMALPNWKQFLNYQTSWMTRDELVEATYDVALSLNRAKVQHGLIDPDTAEKIGMKIQVARDTLYKIDKITQLDDPKLRAQRLKDLKSQIEGVNQRLLCPEDELLRWPSR
ncbi:MAG: TIGR04190 family B12-binding domain/radical SAM domain protein [Nitrososphaerales archaeon]